MAKKFAVIGMGEFGLSVVKTLSKEGNVEVLAIDKDPDRAKLAENIATNITITDATNENSLKQLDIASFDAVIIAIGRNIETTSIIVILLKDLGVKFIIAKAKTDLQKRVLEKLEVNRVFLPEVEGGERVASILLGENIIDSVIFSDDVRIIVFKAPENFYNKTIGEIDIRKNYNLNVIGIKDENNNINTNITADTILKEGDILLVIGNMNDVQRLQKKESRS